MILSQASAASPYSSLPPSPIALSFQRHARPDSPPTFLLHAPDRFRTCLHSAARSRLAGSTCTRPTMRSWYAIVRSRTTNIIKAACCLVVLLSIPPFVSNDLAVQGQRSACGCRLGDAGLCAASWWEHRHQWYKKSASKVEWRCLGRCCQRWPLPVHPPCYAR